MPVIPRDMLKANQLWRDYVSTCRAARFMPGRIKLDKGLMELGIDLWLEECERVLQARTGMKAK